MNELKFNINWRVKVKIHEMGHIMLKKQHYDLIKQGLLPTNYEYQELEQDSNDYVEMQLHELMYKFGPTCRVASESSLIDMNIILVIPEYAERNKLSITESNLLKVLKESRRFSKTEDFQKYSDGYKQGYKECLDELEEVVEAITKTEKRDQEEFSEMETEITETIQTESEQIKNFDEYMQIKAEEGKI